MLMVWDHVWELCSSNLIVIDSWVIKVSAIVRSSCVNVWHRWHKHNHRSFASSDDGVGQIIFQLNLSWVNENTGGINKV
jgi:hypothetical protein